MSEGENYEHYIVKEYREAIETCFGRCPIDECIPAGDRIYDGNSCYAFNDVYDQVKILRDLKEDSPEFEHIMKHLWSYFRDVNNIYRHYWEIEKPVPQWFDKKYRPLMIPLSENELKFKEQAKKALQDMKENS